MNDKTPTLPIRVGLVGFGNWARNGHARALSLLPAYQLSALYTRRPEVAKEAVREHGFTHVVDSLDALVTHPEVDLVVVLNTVPQHAQTVRAAIEAGKDVYCEWPLTTSAAEARRLEAAARRKGVRHIVGLQRRVAPHTRYLRDLIRDGFPGRLLSVRMHVSTDYFQPIRPESMYWTVPPENFSSVVAIYGGHFLDMLFTATGWPETISGLAINQIPQVTFRETGEVLSTTVPDQLVLTGSTPEGTVFSVHIEGAKRNGSGVQIDITGDAGDIRITNTSAFGGKGDDYVVHGAHGDHLPLVQLPVPASYDTLPPSELPAAVLELAHLYAAYANDLEHGTSLTPTFADAVRMHELIEAAEYSTKQGLHVSLH